MAMRLIQAGAPTIASIRAMTSASSLGATSSAFMFSATCSGLLAPVITAAVNLDAGLPSAAGKNVAVLNGNFYTTLSTWVAKYDKKLLKEKEHPKK